MYYSASRHYVTPSLSLMLSPLRSIIPRPLWLRTRLVSSQATEGANESVIQDLFGPKKPQEADPPLKLNKIEVPLPQDPLLDFFSSQLMNHGKRARAERCASEILLHINALTRASPVPILRQAVLLASPAVKVVTHKSSAKAVPKPFALNESRGRRWRLAGFWMQAKRDRDIRGQNGLHGNVLV